MDIPCLLFVDEILEKYPDTKVILTNRDIDSWQTSFQNVFPVILGWKTIPFMSFIDPVRCIDIFFIDVLSNPLPPVAPLAAIFPHPPDGRGQMDRR